MRSRWLAVVFLFVGSPCLAQQGPGSECTPAGSWYGGSVVAYQMTIVPSGPAGRYTVIFEGMYKNSVMNTQITGRLVRKGRFYEGSLLSLITADPDFLNPPPIGKMPDLTVGWTVLEMLDCHTIRNVIPFFGHYFAGNIWSPGITWALPGKVPLWDPPDLDLLDILAGGHPIVETYRRLPETVNPALLHHD
jgi:hypothetical protein